MGLDEAEPAKDQKPVDRKAVDAKRPRTLLQLNSDIVLGNGDVDENVEIAQAYLEAQFPDDFPKPPPPPKPAPKQPSPEETAEKERKALLSYAAGVAEDAKAYQ